MDNKQKQYYFEMAKRGRLYPLRDNGRCGGFITFYIGDMYDKSKFVRNDMWKILEDNNRGEICFIDQLITDKQIENRKLSYNAWYNFKSYIKNNFCNVKSIRWNRWKNNKVNIYEKNM